MASARARYNGLLAPLLTYFPVSRVFFAIVLLIGLIYLPRKKELVLYIPFMLTYIFLAHYWIDRYLFCLWPLLLPTILTGLNRVFAAVGKYVPRIIAVTRNPHVISLSSLFFLSLFLNVQALVNLLAVRLPAIEYREAYSSDITIISYNVRYIILPYNSYLILHTLLILAILLFLAYVRKISKTKTTGLVGINMPVRPLGAE